VDPITRKMHGHIMVGERSFVIENMKHGATDHLWKELNIKDLDHDEQELVGSPNNDRPLERERYSTMAPMEESTDNQTLVHYSIIFYYTKDFAANTEDINGFIDHIVAELNQGYANSKVPLVARVHCKHALELPLMGESLGIVERFAENKPGLHESADVAVLLVNKHKQCGEAFKNSLSHGATYSVVKKDCAAGYYSLGQHIGINIGLLHNVEANENFKYPQGHGHLIEGGYRTIMAYPHDQHHPKVNYYSNPEVLLPATGTPTGVAGQADNADVLIRNRFKLAAVGDESITCKPTEFTPAPTPVSTTTLETTTPETEPPTTTIDTTTTEEVPSTPTIETTTPKKEPSTTTFEVTDFPTTVTTTEETTTTTTNPTTITEEPTSDNPSQPTTTEPAISMKTTVATEQPTTQTEMSNPSKQPTTTTTTETTTPKKKTCPPKTTTPLPTTITTQTTIVTTTTTPPETTTPKKKTCPPKTNTTTPLPPTTTPKPYVPANNSVCINTTTPSTVPSTGGPITTTTTTTTTTVTTTTSLPTTTPCPGPTVDCKTHVGLPRLVSINKVAHHEPSVEACKASCTGECQYYTYAESHLNDEYMCLLYKVEFEDVHAQNFLTKAAGC